MSACSLARARARARHWGRSLGGREGGIGREGRSKTSQNWEPPHSRQRAFRLLWGHRETFCALSSGRQMRHCRRSRLCSQNCDPPHVLHVPVCVHAHVSRACIRTCTPGLNRRMRIHICVHAHEACGVACARKHARKHVHAPMQALGYTHACKQRSPATCASAAMLARMYAAEKARRRGQPARRAHASPRAAPRNSDGGKMA